MDLTRYRNTGAVVGLLLAAAGRLAADLPESVFIAPGRTTHPIFSLAASPPPTGARLPAIGALDWSATLLLSQGFQHGWIRNPEFNPTWIRELYMDYESLGLQLDAEWGIAEHASLGAELAAAAYYGGVLDNVIEPYHLLFGFPNYLREDFPRDQILIDIPLADGRVLSAAAPAWLLYRPLIWTGLDFFATDRSAGALRICLFLPTPELGGLNPGRGPAVGATLYFDWRPWSWLELGASIGGSADPAGLGWSARGGLTAILGAGWRFEAAVNALSSPAAGLLTDTQKYEEMAFPNADLLIGFAWRPPDAAPRWRLTIAEDPITHNSADISAYFSVSD